MIFYNYEYVTGFTAPEGAPVFRCFLCNYEYVDRINSTGGCTWLEMILSKMNISTGLTVPEGAPGLR